MEKEYRTYWECSQCGTEHETTMKTSKIMIKCKKHMKQMIPLAYDNSDSNTIVFCCEDCAKETIK